MVQVLLTRERNRPRAALALAAVALACAPALWSAPRAKANAAPAEFWKMSLEGGRSLTWERNLSSEAEVKTNHGFWNKVWDVVAGEPEYRSLVQPYAIAVDSRQRLIVTDPGASGVHIFDLAQHKYKLLQRRQMVRPQGVAVDAQDNIYVTDSEAGVIFVFDAAGKFLRAIGSLKGGEGYFKRPTGIAVDSAAQRIYVTDTLRDKIFVLGIDGVVLGTIGQEGEGNGEFNRPTDLRLNGDSLLVVDSMNFRVQAFDRAGKFQYAIGKLEAGQEVMIQPGSVSVDSEGDLYVVDGLRGLVQVFNHEGQLLYFFGTAGTHAGEFQLPAGLVIGHDDHVYVVDSFNRRVQIFQYVGLAHQGAAK